MQSTYTSAAALEGIRVIDMTTVVFGPYATQTLAEYGADVVKIEAPEGDGTRYNGPAHEAGMSAMFLGANRGKRSVVLDLKKSAAREALCALCQSADVFIHNMRPQKLRGLGLSREGLRERNPRLVFVALHGFGEGGAYAGAPAYDDIIQALSGAADLVRRQYGTPGYMPTVMADKIAGQMAVHAVLAALFQRERTGEGQVVEVPMFEAVTSFLLVEHLFGRQFAGDAQASGQRGVELGYPRLLSPWRRPYETADGHACVMPYSNENWRRFFGAIGRQDLLADPRFVDIAGRSRHVAELLGIVGGAVRSKPTAYWLSLCRELDIPCAPVNRLEDLERDPHLCSVDFFQSVPLGNGAQLRFPRFPLKLSASRAVLRPPPRLGQHTEEILCPLGLPESVLSELLSRS